MFSLPNPLGPTAWNASSAAAFLTSTWPSTRGGGHQVALKVLHPHHVNSPEVLRRFQREGEQMLKLRHPHIAPADDAGQVEGHYFIALEYMPGGSWPTCWNGGACRIWQGRSHRHPGAAALDYVHPAIIHRDLKPR